MNIVSGIVVFQMIWWIVWFIMLPIGVKMPDVHLKGNASSAPENPYLKKKLLVTTLITLVLWGCTWAIIENELIQWDLQAASDYSLKS